MPEAVAKNSNGERRSRMFINRTSRRYPYLATIAVTAFLALCTFPAALSAQYRDRDRDQDRDYRITRIEPGTLLAVRMTESIDVERKDNRVYYGTVDQDVRGDNGR